MRRWARWSPARSAIGVDVSPTELRAAQLGPGPGGPVVVASARLACAPGEDAASPPAVAALAGAMRRLGFAGDAVVGSAPASAVVTAVMELPPRSSGAPLGTMAAVELARLHKREPGSLEVAHWELPAPRRAAAKGQSWVMAAGCDASRADALAGSFDAAGLALGVIDVRAWALARVGLLGVAAGEVAFVLDVGEGESTLLAAWDGPGPDGLRGPRVLYERALPGVGLGPARAKVAASCGVAEDQAGLLLERVGLRPDAGWAAWATPEIGVAARDLAEALASEAAAASAYVAHEHGLEARWLRLSGPGARVAGLAEAVAGRASLRGEVRADVVDGGAGDPALAVAVGLAMHPEGWAA